jgi:RHS repeat-associated protein
MGARYYGSTMGRFMTPDWAEKPSAIPYSQYDDPQSLNLYTYVRNNPITKIDADGHCAQQASGGKQDCRQVKVEAKVDQKPTTVQNQTIKDVNGKVIAKATGVEGKIVDTVTVNGKPAPNVKVTEANQGADAKNGKPVSSTLAQGKGSTNADGQIGDTIGIYHPTDGTKATNNAIKADFSNNTWSTTDNQTLTLTLPNGCTCSATSTRTMTNAGPDGLSSKYTLTTTQPVVTPAPPPQ